MDNHELQNTSKEVQNSNVTDQTSYVDPRTIEAEIIGELRKDKIGRPILVVQMFIIFGIVLISLPIFTSLLNNPSSFLYKMFNSNGISDAPVTPSDDKREEFLNGGVEQQLASSTNMKFENIVMRNFTLNGNYLNCEMYSYNGNYSYVGKIVEMKDADYPSYTVPSDESGIGSMICSMDGRSIEYTFKNNYLISIKDNVKVVLSEQKDSQAYLNLKKSYEDKANNLGVNAEVEEVADGFSFTSVLDLENYKVPSSVVDYNYYLLDTEAKVINYTLNGKGFDCK